MSGAYFSLRSCSSRQDKASGCSVDRKTKQCHTSPRHMVLWGRGWEGHGEEFTFVLEVLQDGDDGLQRDAVGQEQLPGAVLLEGLPVQRLDWGHRGDRGRWTGPLLTAHHVCVCVCVYFSLRMLSTESFLNITRFPIIT